MPGEITISVLPSIKDINNLFVKLPKDLNWKALFDDITESWYKFMKDVFPSEGAISGERWKTLSSPYAEAKELAYPGRTILIRTGNMHSGYTSPTHPNAKYIRNDRKHELTIGPNQNTIPYAVYHQLGTKKMAQRPVVRFTDKKKKDFINIFRKWAVDKRRENFAKKFKRL